MNKLVGTDGSRWYEFTLEPGTSLVGRSTSADFQVPHPTVSRRHAEVEVTRDGRMYVCDLKSHNGTSLNGKRVNDRIEFTADDRVTFGSVEFQIRGADKPVSRSTAVLAEQDLEKSVFLDVSEALKPLPTKVTQSLDLWPALSKLARMRIVPDYRDSMLEEALEIINRIIPGERLAVLLVRESNELETAALLLRSQSDPGQFRLSRTLVNEILTNNKAIVLSDPGADPRFADKQSIIMSEMHSAMAVPLSDEEEVLGILYVDTSNPMHRYTDEYLRVLATFGNIVASKLLNFALITERQEKKVFDSELARASSIQKNLLKAARPDIEGYELNAFQVPARVVGGDLYDVGRLPDGRVVLVVGDVSGKGMGAAMLMSSILTSCRILYNTAELSVNRVVAVMSDELHRSSTPGDFATFFIAVLDPEKHTMTYVNAGHNPPLLIREGQKIEYLEPGGVMIGAFPGFSWDEATVKFERGDILVVFTDGVTEAEDTDGQLYGQERLNELVVEKSELNMNDLTNEIYRDICSFEQGVPRSDDITMLLAKRVK